MLTPVRVDLTNLVVVSLPRAKDERKPDSYFDLGLSVTVSL